MRETEPWLTPVLVEWADLLCNSFRHWTGRTLVLPGRETTPLATALFEAPRVVVSHGTEIDPLLNYGNRLALRLWEMSWREFVGTPSRLTAESLNREARARALNDVDRKGFVDDYTGVRISASGHRFRISGATIWNVVDKAGHRLGQAATFADWQAL